MGKNALKIMWDGFVSSFEYDGRNTNSYKNLFKKIDGSDIRSLLRDIDDQMIGIVFNALQAIEAKSGKTITREQMSILFAISFLTNRLEKMINEAHGFAYCVDETFEVLNNPINETEA